MKSINQDALQDIRDAADWYNFKTKGLGDEFKRQAISKINSLKKNPSIYTIRYTDVLCLLIKTTRFLFILLLTKLIVWKKFLLFFIPAETLVFGKKGFDLYYFFLHCRFKNG